jgi:uncharacterized protein
MISEALPHLRFRSGAGEHLFVPRYSRLFDLNAAEADAFDRNPEKATWLEQLGRRTTLDEALDVPVAPQPQSISLNVSASCNLACGYCYAARGNFGGRQTAGMDWPTAQAAIDRLLAGANHDGPVTIGFMGGEPLLARALIARAVDYAAASGADRGLDVRFSITTNGTLLEPTDIELFRRHPFAVTISLDGAEADQDRQRPQAGGRGSYASVARRIAPLLADRGSAQLAARATITARSQSVGDIVDALLALGFPEVGVSPLRTGPSSAALTGEAWRRYGDELIALGARETAHVRAGGRFRFTNFAVALKQIHRGACSPYPCGAGGGYFSVGSDGDWYACHRAIGDERFRLGSNAGLDADKRAIFLSERHVDAQTDCKSCWARYLCSGGCHQEAERRSPESCDFIRRWLQFCLESYCELSDFHHHLTHRESIHV